MSHPTRPHAAGRHAWKLAIVAAFALLALVTLAQPQTTRAEAPLQTVTFFGASDVPVGQIDPTADWTSDLIALDGPIGPSTPWHWTGDPNPTWNPGYAVGSHPWGFVSGSSSWINCGPTTASAECTGDPAGSIVVWRVRFAVPSGWSNPTMALEIKADNAGTLFLNGQQITPRFVSGGSTPPLAIDTVLQTGINEMWIVVEDWGGLAGFNYRADISMNAPAPILQIGADTPPADGDGDGVPDALDAFPADPTEWTDTDGDGIGDNADPDPLNPPAELCAPGFFSQTGAEPCAPAPAGSFVADAGATSATLCAPGTFSDIVGAVACQLAPAGTYVPAAGAAAPTACPAGYTSEVGAIACFPVDTDGDGVPDIDDAFPTDPSEWADSDGDGVGDNGDAFPNSDLGATVAVAGCDSGVANLLLGAGTSMNDLLAAAIADAPNHGAAVRAVADLTNDWKAAGLISGKEKGAIQSCIARSDAGKKNR